MMDDRKIIVRKGDKGIVDPFMFWTDFDDIFNSFRRDMNKMFWEPTLGNDLLPRMRVVRKGYQMPMDLEDKGDRLLLTVDIPGVKKENTRISIEDGILSLSVKEEEEKKEEEEGGKFLFRERSSYSCSRCIRLPEEIDEENISAKIVDGILNIEMPKKEVKEKIVKEIDIE